MFRPVFTPKVWITHLFNLVDLNSFRGDVFDIPLLGPAKMMVELITRQVLNFPSVPRTVETWHPMAELSSYCHTDAFAAGPGEMSKASLIRTTTAVQIRADASEGFQGGILSFSSSVVDCLNQPHRKYKDSW